LLPQRITPRLVERIARLGASSVSFDVAQALLADLLQVELSSETVRRITETVGRHTVALESAEAVALGRSLALPREGLAATVVDRLQQVSVDGAMVPLVGGTWEEVKCVAIGRVEAAPAGPKAVAISYFARLADADRFIAEARLEMHQRGTENAREVVAVTDGAEWIQRYLDEHCPNALRIIDWAHAAGYLSAAGQALFGLNTPDGIAWTETQRNLLWEGHADTIVAELKRLDDTSERLRPVREAAHYLAKRLDMLHYAAFRAGGYPIGSGSVESANKLIVEQRLKGPGKHWARSNVDSMLALRCLEANRRWATRWPTIRSAMRRAHRHRPTPLPPPPPQPTPQPIIPGRTYVAVYDRDGRPTPAHPWKRQRACRAKT
jgi:hypothetical protein